MWEGKSPNRRDKKEPIKCQRKLSTRSIRAINRKAPISIIIILSKEWEIPKIMILKAKTSSRVFRRSKKGEAGKGLGRASLRTTRRVLSLHQSSLFRSNLKLDITTGKNFSIEKIPIALYNHLQSSITISMTTNTLLTKKVHLLNLKLLPASKIDSWTSSHAWIKR